MYKYFDKREKFMISWLINCSKIRFWPPSFVRTGPKADIRTVWRCTKSVTDAYAAYDMRHVSTSSILWTGPVLFKSSVNNRIDYSEEFIPLLSKYSQNIRWKWLSLFILKYNFFRKDFNWFQNGFKSAEIMKNWPNRWNWRIDALNLNILY